MAFSWIQVMTKCSRSCARYVLDRWKLADAFKCIDTGADFPTDQPQPQATIAMGDLLVQFLEVLADPVIPTVHHSACCAATTRDEAYACLDLLPHTNTNVGTLLLTWLTIQVLISVTSLLRFLLEGELPEKHLDDYGEWLFSSHRV